MRGYALMICKTAHCRIQLDGVGEDAIVPWAGAVAAALPTGTGSGHLLRS